ncbi:MAG: hypothetical protein HQL78_04865 [Magnetococcales bacterium]|nr:hypothetical protein [Magnetococcales bacterium]
MEVISAEQLILESGKSAFIKAAFQAVVGGTINGEPRFSPIIGKKLGLALACRHYAPALLELVHMVHIAQACENKPGQFEGLFWETGTAKAANFRQFIEKHMNNKNLHKLQYTLSAQGVTLHYPDGVFLVTYARMPFLTALMEFLLTAGGYDAWGEPFRVLLANPASMANSSSCAGIISRQMHHFLNDHLPTLHNLRKFRRLIRFMVERDGKDFSTGDLDDDAVLEFWLSQSAKKEEMGVGFLTFRVVVSSFMDLYRALEQAWQVCRLESAVPWDGNRGDGKNEIRLEPEGSSPMMMDSEWDPSPLTNLQEPPMDEIGWLNHEEATDLLFILDHLHPSLHMPLSVWRCEVFCPAQKRIGAQAQHADKTDLQTLIHNSIMETYEQRHQKLHKRLTTCERLLYATLYALIQRRRSEALTLILNLRPNVDLSGFKKFFFHDNGAKTNLLVISNQQIAEQFFNLVTDPKVSGQEITELLHQAKQAFSKTNRRGFNDADFEYPLVIDGFAQGVVHLQTIIRSISTFLDRITLLAPTPEDRQAMFQQDVAVFSRQFQTLYKGEKSW